MKLVPDVRAVIIETLSRVVPVFVLHVTPSRPPVLLSFVSKIVLLAVTAVVFTTRVSEPAPVGIATDPAAAEPQTAGEAPEVQ